MRPLDGHWDAYGLSPHRRSETARRERSGRL